jgi:excisionase family DNA binding protein
VLEGNKDFLKLIALVATPVPRKPEKIVKQVCITMDKCISVEQLADYLGIGMTLTRQLIWRGEIKSYKIGRLVRVRLSAVEEYLNHNERRVIRLSGTFRRSKAKS